MESKRIRVFVAVNDAVMMRQCHRVLQRIPEVWLVGIAKNGEEAYQKIKKWKPEVVITEVLMPKIDGYTLLEMLEECMGDRMPDFMMCYSFLPEALSAMGNSRFVIQCHAFPVQDRVLAKQFKAGFAYHMKKREAKSYRLSLMRDHPMQDEKRLWEEDGQVKPPKLETIVSYELSLMGARADYRGYRYIFRGLCIKLSLPKGESLRIVALYKRLAEEEGIPFQNVERAMRTAVAQIWTSGNAEYLKEVWGYTEITEQNRPTNGNFIAHMTYVLLREYIW